MTVRLTFGGLKNQTPRPSLLPHWTQTDVPFGSQSVLGAACKYTLLVFIPRNCSRSFYLAKLCHLSWSTFSRSRRSLAIQVLFCCSARQYGLPELSLDIA